MNALGQMTPYTIYVPQGRCARIDAAATHRNVKSLFTNDFSTCNIVAFQGRRSVSLIHFDTVANLDLIKEELEWTKELFKVTVLYREGIAEATELNNRILNCLSCFCRDAEIKLDLGKVNKEDHGIELTAELVGDGTLQSDLFTLTSGEFSEPLLRHPQELLFLTAQKIEQLYATGNITFPRKQAVIFDGECWQKVPDTEMTPFCPTQNERDLLDKLKSFAAQPTQIRETMCKFAQKNTSEANAAVHANNLIHNALNYANSYDQSKIFKIRMIALIKECRNGDSERQTSSTFNRDEQKCVDTISNVLKSSEDTYREVESLMRRFQETMAWKCFYHEFNQIAEDYLDGKMYADIVKQCAKGQIEARQLAEEGNALSQQGKFAEAADKLKLSLFHARQHMTADNPFITACKNNYNEVLDRQNAQGLVSSTPSVTKRRKTQE